MAEPTSAPPDQGQFLVSSLTPGRGQKRLAGGVVIALLLALLAAAPVAHHQLIDSERFLPAYAAAVLVNELITAALLLALFAVQRSTALFVLAIGYLFSALAIVPWALTFPGVFGPAGLLDAGPQGTATIAAARRIGFPLFVLAYAMLKDAAPAPAGEGRRPAVLASILAVVAVVGGLTWLVVAHDEVLPGWMRDTAQVTGLWTVIPATAALICLAGLVRLWGGRRSTLDLWLIVVLCTLLIEILLLAVLSHSRFSIGWWAGRIYGFASASLVLIVLLSETTRLYDRLARTAAAERRSREARLTAMEAVSAAIAHEVSQPLTSMITSADAGLRWLRAARPDLDEVEQALRRIAADGSRAAEVVANVRSMFRQEARARSQLDVNALILEALPRIRQEAMFGHAAVETALDPALPAVHGNAGQLQQLLANLATNAIDAMGSVGDRERLLRLRSERDDAGNILVSVEDNGPGLPAAQRQAIFDPFVSTKKHGMGIGLMICRSIVEAHGGRLWIADILPQGAAFRFTLPAADGAT